MAKHDLLKTHCPSGHPYSGENLYVDYRGKRLCKFCRKLSQRRLTQSKVIKPKTPIRPHKKEPNELRRKARSRVCDAVRYGKITKPSNCEECGKLCEKRKLMGHHYDGYENWDKVKWLCHKCHGKEHYPDPFATIKRGHE